MQLRRHLQEQVVLAALLVGKQSSRQHGDQNLSKNCEELEDEVVHSDSPKQVVESGDATRGDEKSTKNKIVIEEDEANEGNASHKVDADGEERPEVPPCLARHLLLQYRVGV